MSNELNQDIKNKYLRQLPSINRILEHKSLESLIKSYPQALIVKAAREIIDSYKNLIMSAENEKDLNNLNLSLENIVREVENVAIKYGSMSLRRTINATGNILDNRLGRAPLNENAYRAICDVAFRYSNLAIEGDRGSHLQGLLSLLTGAEYGLVTNNNASALMLIINTICERKEIIIARSQLIECDDLRLPDLVDKSSAVMVPVGTTNKTHISDYQKAINENTGAIMKVHKSNYRIVGFTEDVPIWELIKLGKQYNIPVIEDIGSGCLIDLTQYGLPEEPYASLSIKNGVDVVCFSGDKLLSGPSAGIIVGKKEHLLKMKENVLYRVLRANKMTISALEASLRLFLDDSKIMEINPVLKFLSRTTNEIEQMTQLLISKIENELQRSAEIMVKEGYSLSDFTPSMNLSTKLLFIKPLILSSDILHDRLLSRSIPIVTIKHDEYIILDLRTVWHDEIDEIAKAIKECLHA